MSTNYPVYKWFMNAYSNWYIDDYGDQNFDLYQSIDNITIKSGIKISKLKYETSFTLDDNSLYLDVKNNYNKHRNVTYDFDFNRERIITLYVNNKDGLKLFNDLAHYIQLDYLRCNDIDNCNGDAEDTDIFMYKDSFYKDYYKPNMINKLVCPKLVIAYKSTYDKKLDEALINLTTKFKDLKIILITNSLKYEVSNIGNTRFSLARTIYHNKDNSINKTKYYLLHKVVNNDVEEIHQMIDDK